LPTNLWDRTHAISVHPGGRIIRRSLHEALDEIGFDSLVATDAPPNVRAAESLLKSVIPMSKHHMTDLKDRYSKRVNQALRPEERRLRGWLRRRREFLENRLAELDVSSRRAEEIRQELREIEAEVHDRKENWLNSCFRPAPEPTTDVVMVVEGVA